MKSSPYLSFSKATEKSRAVAVDAEGRDGPILPTDTRAAQAEAQGLILI